MANSEGDQTYAELVFWARKRGYKLAWVRFKFKEIYGMWPAARDPAEVERIIESHPEWQI